MPARLVAARASLSTLHSAEAPQNKSANVCCTCRSLSISCHAGLCVSLASTHAGHPNLTQGSSGCKACTSPLAWSVVKQHISISSSTAAISGSANAASAHAAAQLTMLTFLWLGSERRLLRCNAASHQPLAQSSPRFVNCSACLWPARLPGSILVTCKRLRIFMHQCRPRDQQAARCCSLAPRPLAGRSATRHADAKVARPRACCRTNTRSLRPWVVCLRCGWTHCQSARCA